MALSLKEEYEKKYRETVELLKLLGRAGGVRCDLQLTALRETCKLAVAYGRISGLPPYSTTPLQPDSENPAEIKKCYSPRHS